MDFIFAWGISAVICFAGNAAANLVLSPSAHSYTDPPELVAGFIALLQYAVGAFCLGTLTKKTNIWLLAALFVVPLLVLSLNSGTSLAALSRPLASLAFCYIGSVCAIAAGQNTEFNRSHAVLNIPWYHWLWLFPTTLFQAVCVPLTLIFASMYMNVADFVPHGTLIYRCIIFLVLLVFLYVTGNAGKILSSPDKLTVREKFILCCSWLFLTIPMPVLLFFDAGKDYWY